MPLLRYASGRPRQHCVEACGRRGYQIRLQGEEEDGKDERKYLVSNLTDPTIAATLEAS